MLAPLSSNENQFTTTEDVRNPLAVVVRYRFDLPLRVACPSQFRGHLQPGNGRPLAAFIESVVLRFHSRAENQLKD